MPDDSTIPTATFTVEVPAAGERAFVHATVHRGGVLWIGETTNPNFGGTHGIGAQTIDEFMRDGPLGGLTRAEAEPIVHHIASHRLPGDAPPDSNPMDPRGTTPLHRLAGRGDLPGVRALLAAGADPSGRSLEGSTPAHAACAGLHADVIDALLDAGADAGAVDGFERSPLACVIEAWRIPATPADDDDRHRIVRALLAHGGHVGDRDVWRAAVWKRPGILVELLRSGGDAAPARDQDLPIIAGGGSAEILAILVGAGASVIARDRLGRTAVHTALEAADLAALRYLAERGAVAALTDEQRAALLADTRRWKRADLAALLAGESVSGTSTVVGMDVPALRPKYTFTLTEACVMWAHVEAEIELAIEEAGERVQVQITVQHACDPFGDHQEWAWTARLAVSGTVRAGAAPGLVTIVSDDPTVVASLTFDAGTAAHDTMYSDDDVHPWRLPPFDFWAPLFAWGWAEQAQGWSRTLTDDDLARAMAAESDFLRVDQKDSEWGARALIGRIRFWDDRRFSIGRGLGYALEIGARFEKRRAEAPQANRRGWVIVFCAFAPAVVVAVLDPGPPAGATAAELGDWYRTSAGRRPEYIIGWLPDERDADAWLAFLNADLDSRKRTR